MMKRNNILILSLILLAGLLTMLAMPERKSVADPVDAAAMQRVVGRLTSKADAWLARQRADSLHRANDSIRGTLTFSDGSAAMGVVVSDGVSCVRTDSAGRYALKRDKSVRFVFYTVPDYCEVPVHSDSDRTACFYLPVTAKRGEYDFRLRRLPRGREREYRMVVIGDPQVTNAMNPFYTSPDDNPVQKSDIARFTDETMVDLRHTLSEIPSDIPVYGLSMGDDVQYYGGYNAALERQIRAALGSSRMRLFSVIGNHDQDGNALYRRKWEQSWGPTDYSFDRGGEHYVCLNNVQFTKKSAYWSPGELTDRQVRWLRRDLALTPKSKRVVLCYHIPFTFGNTPYSKARPLGLATEEGHYSSSRLAQLLAMLRPFRGHELRPHPLRSQPRD